MKKILFAAMAVLAITSCSQNEEFEGGQGQNSVIKVGSIVKKSPRATILDNDHFTSFKVTSYIVDPSQDYSTTGLGSAYMNGVGYEKTANVWAQTGTAKDYYWPIESKNVQFFGYPADMTLTDAATGFPTLSFTVADASADQTDLVVAALKTAKTGDGSVNLPFQHILTRVNFAYKVTNVTDFTYTIKGIEIVGVEGGTAKYTYGTLADKSNRGSWANASKVDATYAYPFATPTTPSIDDYVSLQSTNGSLMLLPQTIPADAKIRVTYSAINKDNANIGFDGTKEVALTGTWSVGQNICYQLTLPTGAEKITVTGSASEWDAEEPTGAPFN